MQVNTLTHYSRLTEVNQNSAGHATTGNLRKAAEMMAPPKLSDDELRMIRNEFPASKPMVMYTGRGETRQEHVGGTGRMIDITV